MAGRKDPHSQIVKEVIQGRSASDQEGFAPEVPESDERQPTVEEMLEERQRLIQGVAPSTEVAQTEQPSFQAPEPTPGAGVTIEGVSPSGADTARALGEMQKQIADLTGEVTRLRSLGDRSEESMDAGPSGWPWQYYKRPDRPGDPLSGWVVTAPGGASPRTGQRDVGSYARYMAKGFLPLTRYGVAPIPEGDPRPGMEFRTILENGGAGEFPISQVVTCRWHITPPVPGIVFPDYEANKDKVRHFLCEDCDFEMWYIEDDRQTANACFRHLRRTYGDGSHGYGRREATAVMRAQGLEPPVGQFAEVAAQQDLEALREARPT